MVVIPAIDWARHMDAKGAGEIVLTSRDQDGQQDRYDLLLTAAVSDTVSIPVIASGGAGTLKHLYEALAVGKADAVLAASIFHDGTSSVAEVKTYLSRRGLRIRQVSGYES